ncbi:MAG: hypothetical protein JXX29_04110 [Deltaproteobacteria bacterium]|nr:hypothetical protein [Deltaproteobacteria bacterium]MBN2670828.1 hypothetical protein [Deltaproteobacteria bacterium]
MRTKILLITLLSGLLLFGCKVTEEKISLWKSTQAGPQKIAEVLSDSEAPVELRSAAAIALIEIKQHALLTESLEKISKEEADNVIYTAVPSLTAQVKGNPSDSADLASEQIAAKDGLFLLYEFAGPKSKDAVQQTLVDWCTEGDFASRERAGFNIRVIIKKIGAPVYTALVKKLTIDNNGIEPVAKLLRASEDKPILAAASKQIAAELKGNLGKFRKTHLRAAAIIGGAPVGDFLVGVATDNTLNDELRKYALRAYSVALEDGSIAPTESQLIPLVAMAENTALDKYQREEVYLTLAQIDLPQSVLALEKLLSSKEFFWRMVGARCLLRLDGNTHLTTVLQSKRITTDAEETGEFIALIAKFPKIKSALIAALQSSHPYSVAIAINALALMGGTDALAALKKYQTSTVRLPRLFSTKTVGDAATAAIDAIEKKG